MPARKRSFEWVADMATNSKLHWQLLHRPKRLPEVAIFLEDPASALASVNRSRHAVPTHENLTRLGIRALKFTGDAHAVRLGYDAARQRPEQGRLAELDRNIQALFESILRQAS